MLTIGTLERAGVQQGARQTAVAAGGTSQATATSTGASFALVSGASGTNGITMARAKVRGRARLIYSSAATNALLIWPPVGGTINSGTIDASFSATARTPYQAYCISDNGLNWIVG